MRSRLRAYFLLAVSLPEKWRRSRGRLRLRDDGLGARLGHAGERARRLAFRCDAKLHLGERFATRGDILRELLELLHRGSAGARDAGGCEATRCELELLERRDVIVHARDQPFVVLTDVVAIAALIVE